MPGTFATFWRRVSDGIELQQLWAQFRAEARASYELYSKEVEWARTGGESHWRHGFRIAQGLFWAMMTKLSPGRRTLLLIALILLVFPGFSVHTPNFSFDLPNLSFFGGIALLVLLALELADRVTMKRDLEIAREIQSWLMPAAPPQIPGADIAFATRAANTVAGDYYDAFRRSAAPSEEGGERLLLVVADVAGKSVPAALLMATVQASLRTLATLPIPLVDIVVRLNQYVCAQSLGGRRFITAFLAELELATGRLTFINAGHNWPVLRRCNGAIERLQAGGLPLGINSQAAYQTGETNVFAGDLLLIFTDGVIEAENEQEQEYGENRMFGVVSRLAGVAAADALRSLMASVDAFVGLARQHDDITCLILRKQPDRNA